MKKISKLWQYFLTCIFILTVVLTLLLCIRKIGELRQVNHWNSLKLGIFGQEGKIERFYTNRMINKMENEGLCASNKPEIKPEIRSDGSRLVPPILIKQIDPEYPKEAQEKGIQGKVIFKAEIDANGMIKSAELLKSYHPIFVSPALKAIQQWIYRPMFINDKPCKCFATITCVFRLTKTRKKIPVLIWTGII